jgi:hypothetical protein
MDIRRIVRTSLRITGRGVLGVVSAIVSGVIVIVAVLASYVAKNASPTQSLITDILSYGLFYGVAALLWLLALGLPAGLIWILARYTPFARTISPIVFALATVTGNLGGLYGSYQAVDVISEKNFLRLGHTEVGLVVGLLMYAFILMATIAGGFLGSALGSLPLRRVIASRLPPKEVNPPLAKEHPTSDPADRRPSAS